jgi:hypothetical protein
MRREARCAGGIMRKLLAALLFIIACSVAAAAQKGTAPPGYYPPGYNGDIWTGEMASLNEETHEITLTHKSGDKVQTFVGRFSEKGVMNYSDPPANAGFNLKELPPGTQVVAYYINREKKVNGEKVKFNEIIGIKVLPAEKKKQKKP